MSVLIVFSAEFSRKGCRHLVTLLAICMLLVVSSTHARAQTFSGITGTVVDKSGAVVSGANVTATNDATHVASQAVTSSAGTYTITGLIPGAYTVKIEKNGFQTSIHKQVNVDVATQATVDAKLAPGNAAEIVEVIANTISLETDQPEIGTTIEKKLVEEVPIELNNNGGVQNVGRQIDAYLFLAPGVTGGTFSHRINGGVDFQNEVVFNGVPAIQSETHGFQTFINPPFELINEFKVVGTNFSAQYGLAQGAAVYQFASGTNALHGDGFELLRNDLFDAKGGNPAFDAAGHPLTPVRKEDNYGFSVGGPVILPKLYNGKDKTFFYTSWEQYRLNQSVSANMTVPTVAMKQGDLSALGVPIYVPQGPLPAGCTPGAAPGAQFPGNQIPQNCFSAVSKLVLASLPDPNLPGITNNLLTSLISPTRQTSWGFNIDHNLTQRQELHVSFWRDEDTNFNFGNGGATLPENNPLSTGQNAYTLGTGFFLTYTNTLTTHLVMSAGMGWMGEINNNVNPNQNITFPAVVGGVSIPAITFSDPNSQPTQLGGNLLGSINRKLGLSFANNWLWTHGRHTLNIGFDARRAYQDDHECQSCGGSFSFTNLTTGLPANPNSGSALASFLLGQADSANLTFAPETKLRNFSFSPYIQDNVKITSRLTVDAGLRWDIMVPFTASGNQVVFFDPSLTNPGAVNPATGQPLAGAATALGTCTACVGYDRAYIHWDHVAPRLGFAYQWKDKTVIRGGYSMAFLDDGAYEFGDNKVANNYGQLLAGNFVANGNGSNIPGFGLWDTNQITPSAPTPLTPIVANGTGNLHQFYADAGKAPYVQVWSFGVQRELPRNMFLSADYVANKAIHIPGSLSNLNQLNPQFLSLGSALGQNWTSPAGQTALQSLGFGQSGGLFTPYINFMNDFGPNVSLRQALAPFPQYSLNGITDNFNLGGAAFYQSLQFNGQKRFKDGLTFLVNYTLSRTMSNTDSGFSTFNGGALNSFNQRAQWSVADNDQEHVINISGVYELPIGPGKPMLNTRGWEGQLLGGWQLSGVLTYASGTPFDIGVNANSRALSPLGTGNRANIVAGQSFNLDWDNYYKGLPVLNQAAFAVPADFTLGTSPRNLASLRNPWGNNESVAVGKRFYFGEHVNAELRMEFFNIFNRMQVCGGPNGNGNLDANVNDANFGFINSAPTGGVISKCQGNTPRQGQAFFKVSF